MGVWHLFYIRFAARQPAISFFIFVGCGGFEGDAVQGYARGGGGVWLLEGFGVGNDDSVISNLQFADDSKKFLQDDS